VKHAVNALHGTQLRGLVHIDFASADPIKDYKLGKIHVRNDDADPTPERSNVLHISSFGGQDLSGLQQLFFGSPGCERFFIGLLIGSNLHRTFS
jgi:hypothetical protein